MNPKLECAVTASLLGSGARLAAAGNCAAVVGAVGILLAHSGPARAIFGAAVLCWPAVCYYSVRVAIDASLFRDLAQAGSEGGAGLDEVLRNRKLAPERPDRTITDRSNGAIKLWKRLIAITAIQITASLAAILMEVWSR